MNIIPRTPSGPPSASLLRSAIKECAAFTCAPDEQLPPNGPTLTITDTFRQALARDFFEHVFVVRPEFDEIYNAIGADRPILIEGLGGCGKTTTLLAVRNRIGPEAGRVAYINAKSRSDALDRDPGLIWEYAFDELMRSIFPYLPLPARQSWQLTLLRHYPLYRSLRDFILVNENVTNDAQWLALITGKHAGTMVSLGKEFSPNQEAFRLLLGHLSGVGVAACVMLDGLDSVAIPTLRRIVAALFALSCDASARWTPIIALRTSSWRQLSVPDPGALVADVHELHGNPVKELQRRSIQRFVQTKDGVVRDFLLKRLNYVSREYRDSNSSVELEKFRLLLQAFEQCLSETGLSRFLADWHNGSLRACGVAIINMLEVLLNDSDPVDSTAAILHRNNDSPSFNQFLVRSFVYRHLTLTDGHQPQLCVPNVVFETSTGAEPFELLFPTIHFLEYLSNRSNHGVPFELAAAELGPFGYDNDLILHALDRTVARNSGPGMVLLDRTPERSPTGQLVGVQPETEIEILPRGRIFASRLSSSCEFLFWCALDASTHRQFVHRKLRGPINSQALSDPLLRADLALDVVSRRIIPSIRRELGRQVQRETYLRTFTDSRDRETYAVRATRGVLAFLDKVSSQTLTDLTRREKLRKLAEDLRRDATQL